MKILQNNKIKCLFLLIIYLILIYVIYIFDLPVVAAATPSGWGYDVSQPTFAGAYDCASDQCNVSLDARAINVTSSNFYYSTYNQTNLSANGYGYMWVYLPDTPLYSSNLYSVTTYICGETNYSNLVFKGVYSSDTLSNVYGKVTGGTVHYSQVVNGLNPYPYGSQNGAQYSCSYVTTVYKPNNSSKYIGINVTTDLNSNNYSSSLIGYKIESLGSASNLSSSDIQNIINNSGLATSSDISSLNSAISNIQNQISSNITSAKNDINNNIDDAESNIIDNVTDGIRSVNDNLQQESENIQNGIKQGFENCRDSYNLLNNTTFVKGRLDNGVVGYASGTTSVTSTDTGIQVVTNTQYRGATSDFIPVSSSTSYVANNSSSRAYFVAQYDENKTFISQTSSSTTMPYIFTTSSTTKYIRISFIFNTVGTFTVDNMIISKGSSSIPFEKYGEQVCTNRIDETNNKLDQIDTTLTDAGVTGGIGIITGWFDDFNSGTFGLSSIITAPLSLIQSITSKTCSPLQLNIPFVNQTMELPCMTSIYSEFFGSFLTLYQTVTFGITSYWICVRLLNLVKDFKNPDHDEIEVMDL